VLAIGGHPRSGTTLLARLLNSHPTIAVTFEFRPFLGLHREPRAHWQILRKDVIRRRTIEAAWLSRWQAHRDRRTPTRYVVGALDRLESARFLRSYWVRIRDLPMVDAGAIQAGYQAHFRQEMWVGDKFPEYVFSLDSLAAEPDLVLIMICRDPRDVAASAVNMFRRGWGGGLLGERLSTPEGVAGTWSEATRSMLAHQSRCHLVRYETLVSDPEHTLGALGRSIGVDPAGFWSGQIRDDSVGKGRGELSARDIQAVESVAASEMAALGYKPLRRAGARAGSQGAAH